MGAGLGGPAGQSGEKGEFGAGPKFAGGRKAGVSRAEEQRQQFGGSGVGQGGVIPSALWMAATYSRTAADNEAARSARGVTNFGRNQG